MPRFLIWYQEEKALKSLWDSRKVGFPLWVAFAVLTLRWVYRAPPPGYAIGVLAVVAGIMSVREMQTLGKVCWIFLLVGLLRTEFSAIDEDRAESQRQQKQFFDAQRRGFSEIAEQAGTDFSVTTKELKTAIDGLSLNIKVANQTLEQTAPHADLQYRNLSLGGRERVRIQLHHYQPLYRVFLTTFMFCFITQAVTQPFLRHFSARPTWRNR